MSDALFAVLRSPRSVSARRALLSQWKAAEDPRAHVLELQLQAYDGDYMKGSKAARLINHGGAELVGELSTLVTDYYFALGLVADVKMAAAAGRLGRCIELAPIIELAITNPADDRKVVDEPGLGQIVDLTFTGRGVDDELAAALAKSPYMREVRVLNLVRGQLTDSGLETLMRSNAFPNLITIGVTGNPCQDHFEVMDNSGAGYFWVAPGGRALLEEAQHRAVVSSDPAQIVWPPVLDKYA